jgi:hypothetical protein
MFESEVEMEKRSSILPLLLMACLVVALLGLVTYVLMQVRGKPPLNAQEANGIATAALQKAGPAVTRFRTGVVKLDEGEKLADPNYRLLEKAGIVKLSKGPRGSVQVAITPTGESMLAAIPECKKSKEKDGTTLYQTPLADRQLVSIASVTMSGDGNSAVVEYNWKWTPNALGNVFDAGGSYVKTFNLWERQTLINKYQADFYNDPKKSTLVLARAERGWKLSR